jgi:hypothetical protein
MDDPDPIQSAIYDGIKRGIQLCIDNECYGCAMILLYSGIDMMANLSTPLSQSRVTRDDFTRWCDRYIRLPGAEQINGLELYSARCAVVHTYGVESDLTRDGRARQVAFADRCVPEVRFAPSVDPTLVIVSIDALAKAFFAGIDRYVMDLFSDPAKKSDAEARLKKLLTQYPYLPKVSK